MPQAFFEFSVKNDFRDFHLSLGELYLKGIKQLFFLCVCVNRS